ncbi:hypothetical protein HY745_05900 [Candidatus Desantisbacteria bacterium]|nr:hypothetical protein [Candidatus Desantisbacteria bacterium]
MKRLLSTVLFISVLFLNLKISYATNAVSIELSDLPAIGIAYNIFCSRYNEFQPLESKLDNVLIKLSNNIDKLTLDIPTRMAFTHLAFIVQNNITDHYSGFARVKDKTLEESKVPFESILFVTTPFESIGNRILLILSSVSPERTSIVAVDNKLNIELIYDSFSKNEIKNMKEIKGTTNVGSLYSVQVQKPGVLLLQERMEPGGYGFVSPYKNRIFILDVTKMKVEISMKH